MNDRYFIAKHQQEDTNFYPIRSGVLRGSILEPLLNLLYVADLPTTPFITTVTFADDTTATLASHTDPKLAAKNFQDNLNKIENWLCNWKMKANEIKPIHIIFII